MDQRKLIQHGTSSLTISIPNKWLKQRSLKKGDSLYVEEEGNKLIVSTDQSIQHSKITTDISKLDRTSALLYIQSLYRFGYSEIEIKFSTPKLPHYRKDKETPTSSIIHHAVSRLIGAEVVEQTKNRILIKQVTKETKEDFKIILRRVFLILKEMSADFLEATKQYDLATLETIEEKHESVTKFICYALRLLNKYGYPDVKKTSFYYHIIASLDKVADIIKYCARDVINYKKKPKKETIIILTNIHKSIALYYNLFYTLNFDKVNALNKNREIVKTEIVNKARLLPIQEALLITNMKQTLEIILDLTDARMGLEY